MDDVYQFKISLVGIEPPIWRRIHVPSDYSFWDLHVAIQDAMGWLDYHLHVFQIVNPDTKKLEEIGIPDEDGELDILPGWEFWIADYFSSEGVRAEYEYDFGDSWEHEVVLEKILDQEIDSPVCLAGERHCPPEDCGGIGGYEEFLDVIFDPDSETRQEMLTWAGGSFDPEHFVPKKVKFDDPDERWEIAFLSA